jgi:glycosyltransferase involved in cell wall biosynthesis
VETIPTGVDLQYFVWNPPAGTKRVVFTGSMDWLANVDGIEWMMAEAWPQVAAAVAEAEMVVIGKAPPDRLLKRAEALPRWRFAGRVPDIRPYLAGADAYVIPLRIGGGTRIKAFEAMAAGVPVVSTALGVEGLGIEPHRHYLCADDATSFADALVRLLRDASIGDQLSRHARAHVEAHCSDEAVARRFEAICHRAASRRTTGAVERDDPQTVARPTS